jgi:DNA-binding NtrC family response regulator
VSETNETVMNAMFAGASDYMVKALNPNRLLEPVNRLVKSSAMVWTAKPANVGPVWEL